MKPDSPDAATTCAPLTVPAPCDPSLFTTPVSQATWKSVQGDPAATLTPSSADLFARWGGGQTDPTYAQTNVVLANYRAALQVRSLGASGPPPYANC